MEKEHNVLRIKFLGDCYYGVSGVPIKDKRHAKNCVDLGLRMIRDIRALRRAKKINIDMRIGVHSGSIIGGVMGSCKWQYDIWSKDVVIANKLESTGVSGYASQQNSLQLFYVSFLFCLRPVRSTSRAKHSRCSTASINTKVELKRRSKKRFY